MEDVTFKNTLANCNALIYKFCQVRVVLFYVLRRLPTIILVLASTSIRQSEMWVGFPYWLQTSNSFSKFSHLSGTAREWKILPNEMFRLLETDELLESQGWKSPRDDLTLRFYRC